MVYTSKELLDRLEAGILQLLDEAAALRAMPEVLLNERPAAGQWSVAQVLDHLNHYSNYYIPALRKALRAAKPAKADYRSGYLGDYFTRLMQPGAGGTIGNKMSAPKASRPQSAPDAVTALQVFGERQEQLLELIHTARHKNIAAIRVPISLTRWIRLKAGDTLRFVLAHEQRHFVQIRNTLLQLSPGKSGPAQTTCAK